MLPREEGPKRHANLGDPRRFGHHGAIFRATCAVTRPSSCRPLGNVLESDARLAQWTARQRQEAALTKLVRRHLPRALAERVRVAGMHDGVVELSASGGAIAAALRQRATALPEMLRRDGLSVTSVRVRVAVTRGAAAPERPPARNLDAAAAASLFDLARQLPDGPLRDALARWSRRARGR
jgi:hypothetical protein